MKYVCIVVVVMTAAVPVEGLAEGTHSVGVGVEYGGVGYNHEWSGGGHASLAAGVGVPGIVGGLNVYLTDRKDGSGRSDGPRIRLSAGVFLWQDEWFQGLGAVTVGSTSRHWDWGVGIGYGWDLSDEVSPTRPDDAGFFPTLGVGYRFR